MSVYNEKIISLTDYITKMETAVGLYLWTFPFNLMISLFLHMVSSNCNVNVTSRNIFRRVNDLEPTLALRLQDIINTCKFGKYHDIFHLNVCFDHCTLRGYTQCLAVELSDGGTLYGFLHDYWCTCMTNLVLNTS